MPESSEGYQLGRHAAQIETLVSDMASVKGDVAWIKENMAERKGERRVALWLAGSSGGIVVALFGYIARHFKI